MRRRKSIFSTSVILKLSFAATPDDGRLTQKRMEVVLDAAAKENSKAKALTVQQIVDLRYIP